MIEHLFQHLFRIGHIVKYTEQNEGENPFQYIKPRTRKKTK